MLVGCAKEKNQLQEQISDTDNISLENNKDTIDETETAKNNDLIKPTKINGFNLITEEDEDKGYCWKLLYLDKDVINLTDAFQKVVDTYEIWNVFDKDDKKYVFFESGGGCGGCIGLSENYLIFNPIDFSFEARQFGNYKDIALFDRGVVDNYSILSPDKTKIAYVSYNPDYQDSEDPENSGDLSPKNLNEQIKIFDLLTENEQVVFNVPSSETVLQYGIWWPFLIEGTIKWDGVSENVEVTTLKRPLNEDGTYGWILEFEEYLSSSRHINPWDPESPEKFKLFPIDFEGDKINEYAIFYERYENIGNDEYRTNQHLQVYKIIDGKWQTIKEDVAALDNVSIETNFSSINVIDLGADGKEELMWHKHLWKHEIRYSIFAFHEGEYQDLAIPKGYLNSEKYIKNGETGLDFLGAEYDQTGITESYDVYCKESKSLSESDKTSCKDFYLFLRYENGEFFPEIMNKS